MSLTQWANLQPSLDRVSKDQTPSRPEGQRRPGEEMFNRLQLGALRALRGRSQTRMSFRSALMRSSPDITMPWLVELHTKFRFVLAWSQLTPNTRFQRVGLCLLVLHGTVSTAWSVKEGDTRLRRASIHTH